MRYLAALLALFIVLTTQVIFADPPSVGTVPIKSVRWLYASTNVTTSAFVTILASLPADATKVEIFDSSGQTLQLQYSPPSGNPQSFDILPGGNGQVTVKIPLGSAIALKALSANATAGEFTVNFYQN